MNTTGEISGIWKNHSNWPHIIEFDQQHFPRPWSQKDWESLNQLNHKLFAFYQDQVFVGFALFGYLSGNETAHLLKISLVPELRGQGEAKLFWAKLMEKLKELAVLDVYLEVEETNLRARGFYQKMGFKELRTVKGYYSDGTSGVMMSLTL